MPAMAEEAERPDPDTRLGAIRARLEQHGRYPYRLYQLKTDWESGEPGAIAEALFICMELDLPPPQWLRDATTKAYTNGKWNNSLRKVEARGPKKSDDRIFLEGCVFILVGERILLGEKLNDDLFAAVGNEIGLEGDRPELVRKMYYAAKNYQPPKNK
jgi:hypothetical protein